jgi:hypothetical protein
MPSNGFADALLKALEQEGDTDTVAIPRKAFRSLVGSINAYEYGRLMAMLNIEPSEGESGNPVLMAGYSSVEREL